MNESDYDAFKQQISDLFSELESVSGSVNRLQDCVCSEVSRGAAARAVYEEAKREGTEARRAVAAVGALVGRTARQVLATRCDVATTNMQLTINECERDLLKQRCLELSKKWATYEQEFRQLGHIKNDLEETQRAFVDLRDHLHRITTEMSLERLQLKEAIRKAGRIVSEGVELRERARLAAEAHARQCCLTDAEYTQTIENLRNANAEIAHLKAELAEVQQNSDNFNNKKIEVQIVPIEGGDAVDELRAELEAERMRSAELEQKLSAVVADNVGLAARLATLDNRGVLVPVPANTTSHPVAATNITAVDSFLIE